MKRFENIKKIVFIGLVALLTLSGCQSLQPTEKGELSLQDSEFMGLWDTYNSCVADQDPLQMQVYGEELAKAPGPVSIHHSPIFVPEFLKKLTSTRTSRLAVDPRAMAASCTLQAGQVAWRAGQYHLAQDLLQSVMTKYPEPEYAYYVSEARTAMQYVPSLRNVSLPY